MCVLREIQQSILRVLLTEGRGVQMRIKHFSGCVFFIIILKQLYAVVMDGMGH